MYCKNCGATYEDPNAAFCKYCGAPKEQAGQNNYQQNYQQYNQPVPMIKSKNIALCILFSLITCGIYGLFWYVELTEDTNQLSGDFRTSGAMALLFDIITCGIYGIYWAYRQGEKLDYAKQSRGIPSSNSGILYLILALVKFGIIGMALMQNEVNKFATV